jgi:hypothetical protein
MACKMYNRFYILDQTNHGEDKNKHGCKPYSAHYFGFFKSLADKMITHSIKLAHSYKDVENWVITIVN